MGQSVDDRTQAVIGLFDTFTGQVAEDASYRQRDCALNLVRDAVVALDPQGHITYLNQAAERLYGWTTEEVVGRVAGKTLFVDGKDFNTVWRAVRANGGWQGEIAQRTRSGVKRLVESRWSVVQDIGSPGIASVLMVGTEISKTTLTAAHFAHEIRNPLAGIKGVAEAFLQRRQLTRQEREWMEAVRHEVMKIDMRMRELLDLSQARIFNIKECLLSELISGVVLLATHQVKSMDDRHGRRIAVEFIDTTAKPLVMHLDPARIEDAVLNLVLNAIESIDADGRVIVRLRCRQRANSARGDREAVIEIIDTGCGIPLEIRRKIFEPSFTTKRDGTGLGLAVVRRTAAAYHGRITFTTRIGRGSKFILALPLNSQRTLTKNP